MVLLKVNYRWRFSWLVDSIFLRDGFAFVCSLRLNFFMSSSFIWRKWTLSWFGLKVFMPNGLENCEEFVLWCELLWCCDCVTRREKAGASSDERKKLGRVVQISASALYLPLSLRCTFLYRTFHRSSLWISKKGLAFLDFFHSFHVSAVCKVPGTSLSPGWIKWALIAQRTEL